MAKQMDRLTMDSTAALKAGMSYGKWKVLHPHTDMEAPQVDKSVRRCKICGKEMPRCYKNRLYCDAYCSYEAQKMRARECNRRKKERSLMENGQV